MTTFERSAAQAAQEIAVALEHAGIPYAIGGALAVAGVPRGTAHVDVNVFVERERVESLIDVLCQLGIELQKAAAIERADHAIVQRFQP